MLSKKFAYALRGLTFIALHGSMEKKISLQELSDGIDVPHFFLGKIMQELVRNEIVSSVKGPGGGFWIDDSALNRSAFEILKMIDPKVVASNCLMGKKNCDHDRPCPLHAEYVACRNTLFDSLKETTLFNLAGKVEAGELFLDERK